MARGRLLLKSIGLSVKVNSLSSDTARLLYTWLIAHYDRQGCFWGEPAIVKSFIFPRRTDLPDKKIETILTELSEKKLIVRYTVNGERYIYDPAFLDKQGSNFNPDREGDSGIPLPDEVKTQQYMYIDSLKDKDRDKLKDRDKDNDKDVTHHSGSTPELNQSKDLLVLQVINYLNEKTGSNYRATTQKTADLIKSKIGKEGFTVNDCITVIDKKTKEWLKDPKMGKYLRPETLFGSKFEWYLNQPEVRKVKTELERLANYQEGENE